MSNETLDEQAARLLAEVVGREPLEEPPVAFGGFPVESDGEPPVLRHAGGLEDSPDEGGGRFDFRLHLHEVSRNLVTSAESVFDKLVPVLDDESGATPEEVAFFRSVQAVRRHHVEAMARYSLQIYLRSVFPALYDALSEAYFEAQFGAATAFTAWLADEAASREPFVFGELVEGVRRADGPRRFRASLGAWAERVASVRRARLELLASDANAKLYDLARDPGGRPRAALGYRVDLELWNMKRAKPDRKTYPRERVAAKLKVSPSKLTKWANQEGRGGWRAYTKRVLSGLELVPAGSHAEGDASLFPIAFGPPSRK